MWSSRLFWKMFLAYAGLILLSAAAIVVTVSQWYQNKGVQQIERRLRETAVLVRSSILDLLPQGRTPALQDKVRQLGQEIGTRVTVVSPEGRVLADSEMKSIAEVAEMDDHTGRPELMEAEKQGEGSYDRTSPTLGIPMKYYAVRAELDGELLGTVRTALSLESVRNEIVGIRRVIGFVALVACVLVAALTYFMSTRIIRPVTALTEAADAVAHGDYHRRVTLPNRDELSELADSFNRMSQELSARLEQLRTSGERLATVLSGMDDSVVAVDHQQQILFANVAVGKLLGFSPDWAEGRTLLETVRHHRLQQTVQDTLTEPKPQQFEMDLGDASGRVLAVNATPLPGDPCPGVVLVMRDTSELRRLESLRQEFVANVSHELKTPLSSIKAYAETLSDGAIEDTEYRLAFVEQIELQAERLNQLILDMLSLARIESGQQAFDIETVSLAKVVQESLAHYQESAAAKGIVLNTESGDGTVQVKADEEGVRQILNNLIDNAIKYTPDQGRVTVRWQVEDSMAVVQVQDTGIGVSPNHQPRLFERFFRVDKARSRELGGTGLGLSIVKHLASFFGGTVGVESQPGDGSTFTVKLPLA